MLFARVDLRNHRKIAVFDGWVAYAGSQNITDASFGYRPRLKIGPWIDATVRVEGPAAQALEVVFLRDWELESDEGLGDKLKDLLVEVPIPDEGSTVHVVPSGPGDAVSALRQAFLTAIYSAREELILTTPYFVPDDATRER
jgi:cardiolipin synthase